MTALRIRPRPETALLGDAELTVDPGDREGGLVVTLAGPDRAIILSDDEREAAVIGDDRSASATEPRTIEVVVDGWRFELAVEDDARARLRRRATRDRETDATSGPTEIRAMIPGRVAAVRVAAGDSVEVGQPVLVVEAMKMQNELRAPRAGTVERVAVAVGATIELGDLLVVIR